MRRWLVNLAAFAIVAIAAYTTVLGGAPYLIMSRVMTATANRAGGFNVPASAALLPTAASRGIVKPSPDLLYTSCAFDITEGPVLIGGTPSQAYWSIALYASNTDNFFVVNDREAQGKPAFVVLVSRDMLGKIPAEYKSYRVVEPPSKKGLALFRYLVLDAQDLAGARAVQQTVTCRRL